MDLHSFYHNPHQHNIRRGIKDVILWQLGYYNDPIPTPPPPMNFSYPNQEEPILKNAPQVTWINHSTFLISVGSFHCLTDPIWSKRCSPIPFLGPKRHFEPPLSLAALPKIDVIIISHDHYDHLDFPTIRTLFKQFPDIRFYIPRGVGKWFRKYSPEVPQDSIKELTWGDHQWIDEKQKIRLTSVPAQHFSGRGAFDRNQTLWMGAVLEFPNKCIYYVGDTGYNPVDFKKIGETFGPIDLSLIPIGAYTPKRFMQPVHVNPQEAVQIHQDVCSKLSIAGHWGTFRLASEAMKRPPYDLYLALQKKGIPWESFRVLNPGQTINW